MLQPRLYTQLLLLTAGNRHIATGYATTPDVDIRVWDWVQEPAHEHFIGLPQHCRSKYLLNWPGNSYSARLKYLLLCGSVVVHSDNDWYEFYYPMLKHGEHFMKIRALNTTDDLHNGLTQLVQKLNSNPKRSRHIAANGQHFAKETLSANNVKEYWYRLLKEYAALQTHTIRLHPDAVPLGASLSHPRYIHYRNRTGCHMLGDMGEEDGLPQGPYQPAGYHATAAVSATAEPEAVIAPVINERPVVPDESALVTDPAVVLDDVRDTDSNMPDMVPEPELLEPLDRVLESESRFPLETGTETVGELMAEPASNPLPDESSASVLLPELDT